MGFLFLHAGEDHLKLTGREVGLGRHHPSLLLPFTGHMESVPVELTTQPWLRTCYAVVKVESVRAEGKTVPSNIKKVAKIYCSNVD